MTGSRIFSLLSSVLLGTAVLGWTTTGETSSPILSARDLPREILNECGPATCAAELEFRSFWVGRTQGGNLFVVSRNVCLLSSCMHWLVEQGEGASVSLLELPGSFRFHRVTGRYPSIELRTRNANDDTMRLHFDWNGREYTRTLAQRVYEVSGIECGTRDECHGVAARALKAQDVDRALRIWQTVHGVSWI
jgi:hypothetical protein